MSTCWHYRNLCIKESLFAFKVTPQSAVFAAELIWRSVEMASTDSIDPSAEKIRRM